VYCRDHSPETKEGRELIHIYKNNAAQISDIKHDKNSGSKKYAALTKTSRVVDISPVDGWNTMALLVAIRRWEVDEEQKPLECAIINSQWFPNNYDGLINNGVQNFRFKFKIYLTGIMDNYQVLRMNVLLSHQLFNCALWSSTMDRNRTDFNLIAKNGKRFPVHKSILIGSSEPKLSTSAKQRPSSRIETHKIESFHGMYGRRNDQISKISLHRRIETSGLRRLITRYTMADLLMHSKRRVHVTLSST